MEDKITSLVESSRKVFQDCSLENGAIVAANTDKEYYPENVQNYRFVWPRDASFVIYAAEILGMDGVKNSFLDWMLERMEEFSDTGRIYQRYLVNGPRDPQFGYQYQPDQAGALIWALSQTSLSEKEKEIIRLLADRICLDWNGTCFKRRTWDLWEEKKSFTDFEENFTYSLAACGKGLEEAYKITEDNQHLEASKDMVKALSSCGKKFYPKSCGRFADRSIDASSMGLVWPFDIVDRDEKLMTTMELIEEKLVTPQGIMRYERDMYDGMIKSATLIKKGAGGWPLLMFWYIITLSELGKEGEARDMFRDYIKKIPSKYIPEQIFKNKKKSSVVPLAWSHAMFVIAADKLDFI